ncbi:SH3 domain-containing protein [Bacillus sp. P14.5]|uniref:SH3 domain-containing protein n=1 Tax=Bacillus sp. P14.5 TaxID=1983400 RepID=UPI000DE97CAD|nr:SH3 domain-containing protein [Bacillus sp. P14.5]
MFKSKKSIAAIAITIGLASGIGMTAPASTSADSNVLLASVDWVKSQLSPINSRISQLEQTVQSQQSQINQLKDQIADGSTGPGDTTPSLPSAVYTTNNNVTIHSGATRQYRVIATKPFGSALKVIDKHTTSIGVWYRVELSSTLKGWVFSGDTSTTKPTNTVPTQVVTKSDVHLRAGATTSYSIKTTLSGGTTLKYIQSFKNSLGETWYNVETSNGDRGWIISSLAEVR